MKERSKGVAEVEEAYNNNEMDCYYSTSELPCKKHPSSSSVGICAYCLKDRLVNLVCSDCGEQRLSSCSCSEISSNRNSCTVDVGSVGRVSFLIENEKNYETPVLNPSSNNKPKLQQDNKAVDEVMLLRRSSSNCVDIKRKNGFWRIGKLFRKNKKEKDCGRSVCGGFDEKTETWMVDHNGGVVSRSRSLCSFRGAGLLGSEDGGDSMILSGARSSISAARSSGVNGGLILDSGRRSGYSEPEPRRSGFDGEKRDLYVLDSENCSDIKGTVKNMKGGLIDVDGGFYGVNRRVFSLRESDFKGMDESRFIDLKLDYSSESTKPEFSSASKMGGNLGDTLSAFGSTRGGNFMAHDGGGGSFVGLVGDGVLTSNGSCRINVNDRGIQRGRKNMKGWRWIFKYHPNWGAARKRDEELMFKT